MENTEEKFTIGIISNKIAIILSGLFILFFIFIPWVYSDSGEENNNIPTETETNNTPPLGTYSEGLFLMGYGYVDSLTNWITPPVSYRFKIRSERHSYFVQFSATNGKWTKKFLIDKDTDLKVPSNGTQGPIKITAGPKETKRFRVQLYRKIRVKI